jgi:hypothetical protein
MHGGAQGSGAPKGNSNALKHGTYTARAFRERAQLDELLAVTRKLLTEL